MMQKSTARSPQQQQQNGRRIEPSGKIVVSSVADRRQGPSPSSCCNASDAAAISPIITGVSTWPWDTSVTLA